MAKDGTWEDCHSGGMCGCSCATCKEAQSIKSKKAAHHCRLHIKGCHITCPDKW